MAAPLWNLCLRQLEGELPAQEFNTWIRPLQAREGNEQLLLLAPNRFVLEWVKKNFLPRIQVALNRLCPRQTPKVQLQVGSSQEQPERTAASKKSPVLALPQPPPLNPKFTFDSFVSGKSNQIAYAASLEMADHGKFNPLFIYGGVGLGKTHLMQAIGHLVLNRQPESEVAYLHSERFVTQLVKALQNKKVQDFKKYYRSVNLLLLDDVQFLLGKTHSQEELFHTINTLLEGDRQVILTCDRLPKALTGLEEHLQSRLGSGLIVGVEPPELETRMTILQHKAIAIDTFLPEEVAAFIAENFDSNIRELEGALHRLLASAHFLNEPLTLDICKEALKDLVVKKVKLLSIEEIQKTVAEYYRLSLTDLKSNRRQRYIVRPRQIAMALAKELTPCSFPEIAGAFGRDRTTVLHSYKTISTLKNSDLQVKADYLHLQKILNNR